jgi:hypothetical protein
MKVLLLIVIVFVAISGCVSVQTGNGIVIEDFGPDFNTVYSGEIVNFDLKIRNVGSVTADSVFAELLGVDQDWCCADAGLGPWYKNEKLPNEPYCRYPGSLGANKKQLKPPDPFWSVPGETMTCSWTYKIPKFPIGFIREYKPTVRVFYDYTTTLVQAINLLTRQEIVDIERSGQVLPNQAISLTKGPVSIRVDMASPVRVSESTVNFPIKITIENIGDGTVCLPGRCRKTAPEGEAWNKIILNIEGVQLTDCQKEMEIELYKGQASLICGASLTGLKLIGPEQKLLTITAKYSYFIEKSTAITVKSEQL